MASRAPSAAPVSGVDAITRVLRVHSGEEFTAAEFPTLDEGRSAWEEWVAFRRLLLTNAEFRALYEINRRERDAIS